MSLIALIFAVAAFAMSGLTLFRQDIHARDVDRMAYQDAQDWADISLALAHLHRDVEDLWGTGDTLDLDVPTVDGPDITAVTEPTERTNHDHQP